MTVVPSRCKSNSRGRMVLWRCSMALGSCSSLRLMRSRGCWSPRVWCCQRLGERGRKWLIPWSSCSYLFVSMCGFTSQCTEIWSVGEVENRLWVEPGWGRELWNTPLLPDIPIRVKWRASFKALYSDETWREPRTGSLEHWLLLLVCCWLSLQR